VSRGRPSSGLGGARASEREGARGAGRAAAPPRRALGVGAPPAARAGLAARGAQGWAGGEPGPRARGAARSTLACGVPEWGAARGRPGLGARGRAQRTRAMALG
jgi:hypothetical protein